MGASLEDAAVASKSPSRGGLPSSGVMGVWGACGVWGVWGVGDVVGGIGVALPSSSCAPPFSVSCTLMARSKFLSA